jgi:hypothetical protein
MDRLRIEELWDRFLDGEVLSPAEEEQLLEALTSDAALRAELLEDLKVDRSLGILGQVENEPERFVQSLRAWYAAERDATRFIKKLQLKKRDVDRSRSEDPPAKAGEGSAGACTSSPATTPRSTQRVRAGEVRSYGLAWIAAAGVLLAIALFLAFGPIGPDTAPSGSGNEAGASKQAEARRRAERDRSSASAEPPHRDADERPRETEKKSPEPSQPRTQPVQSPAEEDRSRKSREEPPSDRDRVQRLEQEMKEAIERATKGGRPLAVEPGEGEKRSTLPEVAGVQQESSTQVVVSQVEEVAGEAYVVTKEGKSPVTRGSNVLSTQGLETGGGASRLVLRFSDKSRVELSPETVLRGIKVEKGLRVWAERGVLQAQITKQPVDQSVIFVTPHGEARVLGTTLRILIDPDPKKGTSLEVEEGKVELKRLADGKTVLVEGGHAAVAAAGAELVSRLDPSRAVPRSGLALWLRADQGVLQNTGRVSAWADRSGNRHDAVQSVPAKQPTFVANAVHGCPALRFDGVGHCLTFHCPVTGLSGMTIFLVSAALEDRTGGWGSANAAILWRELENYGLVVVSPFQTKIRFYFGASQRTSVIDYPRPMTLDRDYSVTTAMKSGSDAVLYVNGREGLRLSGQARPVIAKCEDTGQIGRGDGDIATDRLFKGHVEGESYFSGEIAEILVFARALAKIERQAVEQYLLGKYSLK